MNRIKTFQLLLIIIISALAGYYFGVNKVKLEWRNYKPSVAVINKQAPATISNVDFSNFWNVWQKLEKNYYDKSKLDPQKMVTGAIEGMTQSLEDPFTTYLPPVANSDFKEGLAG